tara:strand:+ start:4070 stop:4324 length:255 start_codon:yes stop_codon:yes gene_type:complete
MVLYPKIYDMSILLDNDCKRMLRRKSKQLLIIEVLDKLSTIDQKQTLLVDVSNNNDNINYNSDYIVEKKNLYEIVLNIFGCNKS